MKDSALCVVFSLCCLITCARGACPKGAVQGLRPNDCYVYVADEQSFEGERCDHFGGTLASIRNSFENEFVRKAFKDLGDSDTYYWLGADAEFDDPFSWSDGQPFNYTNWAKGQPGNYQSLKLMMHSQSGQWYGTRRSYPDRPYVCKVPPADLPAKANSTLVRHSEKQCPDGWKYLSNGDKCVKLVWDKLPWYDALTKCRKWNGDLLSIPDQASADSVYDQLEWEALAQGDFSVGLYDPTHCLQFYDDPKNCSTHWRWTDGSPYDFRPWYPEAPGGHGWCAYLSLGYMGMKMGLRNGICTVTFPFACQLPTFTALGGE